jgi:hypothetical protein
MHNITTLQPRPRLEAIDFFGGCPTCWRNDGYLNVDRMRWFICHKHRVKWHGGENLFWTCRDDLEAVCQANHDRIKEYRVVEPRVNPQATPPKAVDDLQRIGLILDVAKGDLGEALKELQFPEVYGLHESRALEKLRAKLEMVEDLLRRAQDLSAQVWYDAFGGAD